MHVLCIHDSDDLKIKAMRTPNTNSNSDCFADTIEVGSLRVLDGIIYSAFG